MGADKQTLKIGEGRPGPGRKKGVPNRTTAVLREAILLAAEEVGFDGEGKDGLTGYLKRVATEDVKAFSTLLGKVLPMQVEGAISTRTQEERDAVVAAALRADS